MVSSKIAAMTDEDLKALLDANAAETRRHFDQMAEQLHRLDETAEQLGRRIDHTAEQLRHHFDITSEGTRHEVRLVAEMVAHVDGKLDREAAEIRSEMRSGFADTQTMIKFSHGELDRRVRVLEQ